MVFQIVVITVRMVFIIVWMELLTALKFPVMIPLIANRTAYITVLMAFHTEDTTVLIAFRIVVTTVLIRFPSAS